MKYYPYGYCRNSAGDLGTDKLFTGQRLDDTGLYYYGARYYDPTIGRFISPDSIVPNPANPQCFNRYSYCLNNPLVYTDPSGRQTTATEWSFSISFGTLSFEAGFTRAYNLYGSGSKRFGNWSGGFKETGSKGLSVSFTVAWTTTTASNVDELGTELRIGWEGYAGGGGGAEVIIGESKSGEPYTGSSGKLGFGVGGGSTIRVVESKEWTLTWEKSPVTTEPPKPASPPNTITQSTLTEFKTASVAELNRSAYSVGTSEYRAAVDRAYNAVSSTLSSGQIVGWSSSQGYHAVDIGAYDYSYYWY
jgi:RHS repeat-associated protein